MFGFVQSLRYTDINSVSGIGFSPIFRWLISVNIIQNYNQIWLHINEKNIIKNDKRISVDNVPVPSSVPTFVTFCLQVT
jgi:hypothetical protein